MAENLDSTLLRPGHVHAHQTIPLGKVQFEKILCLFSPENTKCGAGWGMGTDMPLKHRLLFVGLGRKCHPQAHMSEIRSSAGDAVLRSCVVFWMRGPIWKKWVTWGVGLKVYITCRTSGLWPSLCFLIQANINIASCEVSSCSYD